MDKTRDAPGKSWSRLGMAAVLLGALSIHAETRAGDEAAPLFPLVIRHGVELQSGLHRLRFRYTAPVGTQVHFMLEAVKERSRKFTFPQFLVGDGVARQVDLVFRLHGAAAVPALRFQAGPSQHWPLPDAFEVADLSIEPLPPDDFAKDNALPDEGYFMGVLGEYPRNWQPFWIRTARENASPSTGLVEHSFETTKQVMRLDGGEAERGGIESNCLPMPVGGVIEFSVWARSVDGEPAPFALMLRDPKDTNWRSQKTFTAREGWTRFTLERAVDERPPENQAWFFARVTVNTGRRVLLGKARVRVTPPKSRDVFAGFLPQQGLSRNRIINPDFEVGRYAGGFPGRFWRRYQLTTEECVRLIHYPGETFAPGVEGGRALTVRPFFFLQTMGFPVEVGRTYTASAYLKSDTPGQELHATLRVLGYAGPSEHKTFTVDDEWRRYHFTFEWNHRTAYLNAARLTVGLRTGLGDERLLVDRVQFEEGELSDFDVPAVQIGLETPEELDANVFDHKDEGAALLLKTRCRPEVVGPLRVHWRILDSWDRAVREGVFDLDAAPAAERLFPVYLDGWRGVFRAAFEVRDAVGAVVGLGESRFALLRDYVRQPATDSPITNEIGVQLSLEQARPILPVLRRFMPFSVFNRSALDMGARAVEDDGLVAALRELLTLYQQGDRITELFCLHIAPAGAWGERIRNDPGPLADEDVASFAEYMGAHATRYKGLVRYWEPFNEISLWRVPAGRPQAGQRTMTPEKAARLYRAAYPALKAADPEAMLVGPCSHAGETLEDTERFLAAGGGEALDVLTFHGYCDSADRADAYGRVLKLREILARHGKADIPIWNTEQYFGSRLPYYRPTSAKEGQRGYYRDLEIDGAAAQIVNLIHHQAAGARLVNFSGLSALRGFAKDFHVTAALGAVNAAIEQFDSAGPGERIDLGAAMQCFLFPDAPGGPLATLHTVDAAFRGRLTPPERVTVRDLMGNPVAAPEADVYVRPLYLRFPVGTSREDARRQLFELKLSGFHGSFDVAFAMAGRDRMRVSLANLLNRPGDVAVTLTPRGSNWHFDPARLTFDKVGSGERRQIDVRVVDPRESGDGPYEFHARIEADGAVTERVVDFIPLFADYREGMAGDGDMDRWEGARWLEMGAENISVLFEGKPWRGADDLSARLAVGWNEKGFGLALRVKDDVAAFPENFVDVWNHDSLQLYFDPLADATESEANTADDVEYRIAYLSGETARAYLGRAPADRYLGENNETTGIDGDVKATCRRLGENEWLYDLFFPAVCLPRIRWEPDTSFGFSLLLNDNDGQGRKTGITLSPKNTEPRKAPHRYRNLVLVKQPVLDSHEE